MFKFVRIQPTFFVIAAFILPIFSFEIQNQLTDAANTVKFYLFTNPSNTSDYDAIEYLDIDSLRNSRFLPDKDLIILVHGFTQNYTSAFPTVLIKAYLNSGFAETSNIVAVCWGELSGANTPPDLAIIKHLEELPLYVEVVENIPVVGKRIQEFIVFLQSQEFSRPNQIHLVGQSLGAHACGMAGMYYKQLKTTLLDRITGTDPAGPLFQFLPKHQRLDKTDARFVDIVHTNQLGFGFMGHLGHVDFYVNGGGPIPQPGCEFQIATNPFCSHNTAPHYYSKSVLNNTLKAHRRWFPFETETFGEFCSRKARGSYKLHFILALDEIPSPSA